MDRPDQSASGEVPFFARFLVRDDAPMGAFINTTHKVRDDGITL